jgi:2-amino-4-hydroxy-6-hydroxymethyldihydropteridine diphosphokinase
MTPGLSLAPRHAIIGLGANLGDCARTMLSAIGHIAELPAIELVSRSRLYDTAPLSPPGAPPQPRYRNAAIRVVSDETPDGLLALLLTIERAHGRVRTRGERWGPRTLDLDLLLFGDDVRATEFLTLPHPRLLERAFAIAPVLDVAPELDLVRVLTDLGGPPGVVAWEPSS